MSRHDLIIDFETFGTCAIDCAARNLSTFVFDWERFDINPYTFEEIVDTATRYNLSVDDQVTNYNFKIERNTIDFWNQQKSVVRNKMHPSKNDLIVSEFVRLLMKDLISGPKIEYWWSRNNTFDPTILWRIMWTHESKYRINEYLMHWRVRDIRTWIDAKFNFSTRSNFVPVSDENYWNNTFNKHDSTHDIASDVLRLQSIWRAEHDMEITER